ncbi:MAG TPA: TerB N-terminal domain-containing protein [Paraburkholderia sp.]|nr:TerB N-terminal domain-containing protein [Paraburkholderia sp.]
MKFPHGSDNDEPLVTVTVSGSPDSSGYRIKARPDVASSPAPARWIAPGEVVQIDDISLSEGYFYLGAVRRSGPDSIDACVVDTRASVSRYAANPSAGLGSDALSYGALSGEQRRTYLEWLAGDRKKSDIKTGYLFLYLYGLERRVLMDGAVGKVSAAEYAALASELRRLLNVDADYLWQKHVRSLLDMISLTTSRTGKVYEQTPPGGTATGYQVPLSVRVAFGQAALDKVPVPAGWALAWAKLDPIMARRTAVTRCPGEFDRVFVRKYRERFKDGMLVPPNRTPLIVKTEPAFRALQHLPVPGYLVGLPDISAANGPRNRLQLLVNEAALALDSYSRYLGRNPDAHGTLDATLMLPVELWPDSLRQEIASLALEVASGTVVTTFGKILARFNSTGSLTRDKVASFSAALALAGVALEPDVRLGARTPKPGDALALFYAPSDEAASPVDDAYSVANLMVDLGASVAKAGGAASDVEIALIEREIDAWSHLPLPQRIRLKARNQVQLAQPVSSAGLKKKLQSLSVEVRQAIAAFLVRIANADGVVSRDAVKLLEKIYRLMALDPLRLYSDLHQNVGSDATVVQMSGSANANGAQAAPAATGLALDASRIAALQRETAHVSAILAGVFVEEPPVVPQSHAPAEDVTAQFAIAPQTVQTALLGLDDAHSTFLRLLVSRPTWTRAELADAALDLELMLDGAIEQVNEASLDHWDEPLTDGDDPVEINQDLAQRLAA